ncbi:MAG: sulfate adenylyltransferase subunit 1 [Hyphomicrobiaceae bacterium]
MSAPARALVAERLDEGEIQARLDTPPRAASVHLSGDLKVLTCGSVDDGKSTLIGRLLWDTDGLHADQRAMLEQSPRTPSGTPDFSLLVDGLAAEREQGITIDIAWRYLDLPRRRLVIIDSPGHEQYTRNMATGASHADVAILLVDARSGIKTQTRRHAALLDLMGVRRVVLAVNKMDLVDWSEERFKEIRAAFDELVARFKFEDAAAIPVSSVLGANIAQLSGATPWYTGRPLLDCLARTPARSLEAGKTFRFPIQMVLRAGQDFRGLAGTVTSGTIAVGDEVLEPVSGRCARVRRIVTMNGDLDTARNGQAVVLDLDTDTDISRGAMLVAGEHLPVVARSVEVSLVWLSEDPLVPDRGYLLRTATDLVPVGMISIRAHIDLETIGEIPAAGCAVNDIAVGRITLGRSIAIDRYADHMATGCFILVDPISGATIAAGAVTDVAPAARPGPRENVFRLTRDLLARGIGADLATADKAADEELRRRANEIAILMREAGVTVEVEGGWHRTGLDITTIWLGLLGAMSFGLIGAIVLGLV